MTCRRRCAKCRRRDANAAGSSYQLGITELLQAAAANSASQYRKLADVLPLLQRH
jgi:hypothetical protein